VRNLAQVLSFHELVAGNLADVSLSGLATNFWTMIFIRSISGALNGNVAVVKAAIGDITDESNSTEAFAMYGLTWTIGSIIG
jgi:MFS family permease